APPPARQLHRHPHQPAPEHRQGRGRPRRPPRDPPARAAPRRDHLARRHPSRLRRPQPRLRHPHHFHPDRRGVTMPFNPIILAESALTIDGDAFEGQISSAVFTPSSSPVTWTAINGQTYTRQTPATWTLDLGYAQDWAFADALS